MLLISATVNSLGGQPLLDLLAEFGTWPVLNSSWTETDVNIEDLVTRLAIKGLPTLAEMGVIYDLRNASFNALYVSFLLPSTSPVLGRMFNLITKHKIRS